MQKRPNPTQPLRQGSDASRDSRLHGIGRLGFLVCFVLLS
jgi:hypothetical protein